MEVSDWPMDHGRKNMTNISTGIQSGLILEPE